MAFRLSYWHRRAAELVILAVSLSLLTVAAVAKGQVKVEPFEARCGQLQGKTVATASIELPTHGAEVADARLAAASGGKTFCKVLGVIRPVDSAAADIHFEINLPAQWNEKVVHVGGGGYNGFLVDGLKLNFATGGDADPVGSGFTTLGSDSGHRSPGMNDPQTGAFALNREQLENFAGAQLKKTHDVALDLIRRFYRQAPRRFYFYGNSQGGHEGLIVAQRWPDDYDGVVAIHPAYNFTALQLSGLHLGKLLYSNPAAWLSPGKVALIAQAVLKQCDALDGLKDGIVNNVGACRSSFNIDLLRCAKGSSGSDECLCDEQIKTAQQFEQRLKLPFTLAGGVDSFSGWPLLSGAFSYPGAPFALGSSAVPAAPPSPRDAFVYFMADQMIRYMVMQDPAYPTIQFEPEAHRPALEKLSSLIDASDADLDKFRQRGGKLLLLHGAVDMAIPPGNSVDYWSRLTARYGGPSLREFARFYLVPGFGHGDGSFQLRWDGLTLLDRWVEKHHAPVHPVIEDGAPGTGGRTRPLCEYPQWPKYLGTRNSSQADSFRCASN